MLHMDMNNPGAEEIEPLTCDKCEHELTIEMEQTTFSHSFIVLIAKLVISVALRFWRACTAGLLILLLCFWLYGSLVAFTLMIVSIIGK